MKQVTVDPMLAKDGDIEQIKGSVIVQPKLDGVRAVYNPTTRRLHTRNGLGITSCDHIIDEIFALGLQNHSWDGELYHRDLPFQTINGLTRKKRTDADTGQLQLHVFDVIDRRKAKCRAESVIELPFSDCIKPVATFFTSHERLYEYYQCFLDSDLEGMIVRAPDALYQSGKSNALLRIKPVQDAEAILIGFEPSKSSLNSETFGSMVLQLPNGKQFKCSGITQHQRETLWRKQPIGASVTYLFKGLTNNGIPREPRFKGIRHDLAREAI